MHAGRAVARRPADEGAVREERVAGWAAFGRDFLDRTVRSEPRTHVRLSHVNPTDRKLLTCAERPMKKMPMFAIPIRHGAPGTAPGTRPGGVIEGGTARPVHLPGYFR
jgi:hypothetical protein